MWKLRSDADQWEPLPGVPWRDMTDDEFRDAAKAYSEANGGAEHGFGPRVLQSSGWFEHIEDKAAAPKEAKAT